MDPDIANGTCYYGYNKAAGSELVPCGNAGIANVPCCFAGDYCDADNTCYNDSTGNTYLAGCTDAQYTDGSCPWKSDDFDEQEWVGLVRCDAVNKTANEWAWAGCSVPSDAYTSLRRMGTCDCTSKATLFVGEQALLRHASLPSSVGGTISWEDGYAVTAAAETTSSSSPSSSSSAATAGSAATGSSASATTTTTSAAATAATDTQAASGSGDGGADPSPSLSTGAKAGIAVGAIGAVLSVLAIAVMVFLHRRRRRGDQKGEYSEAPRPPPPHDKVPGTLTVMMTDGNDGMAPPAYPAYSGHKAELPGSSLSVVTTTQQALSPGLRSTPSTVSRAQSEFGERRMSLVSELSNNDDGPRVLYQAMPTQAGMAPISELQG